MTDDIFVSIVSETQMQAVQMLQMMLLPSILLSGYVFPFDSMPAFFKTIGLCLPVTHFISISRGVILRGAGLDDLIIPFIVLIFYGIFFLLLRKPP